MQPSVIFSLFAASLVSKVIAEEVVCYAPDGETIANNKTYVPCNKLGIEQDGVFSSCCQLDGEPDERDLCTSNGLCLRNNVVSRGYCTDKSWKSPACVNVCGSEEEGGSSNGTTEITSCADNTYCCGSNNLQCCGTSRAFKIPMQVRTSGGFESDNASSTYKNATIGLAAAVGAIALISIGVIFWLLRRIKSLRQQVSEKAHTQATPVSQVVQPYSDAYLPASIGSPTVATSTSPRISEFGNYKPPPDPARISEIHGESRYSELDGGNNRHVPSPSPRDANFNPSIRGSPLPSPGPYHS